MGEFQCTASPGVENKLKALGQNQANQPRSQDVAKVLADSSPSDISCIVGRTAFPPNNSVETEKAEKLFSEVARLDTSKAAKAAVVLAENSKNDALKELVVPRIIFGSESASLTSGGKLSFIGSPNDLTKALYKINPKLTEQMLTARGYEFFGDLFLPGEASSSRTLVENAVKVRLAQLKSETSK
jgi:hypothetical protein